jgi:hypothetical protein
MMMSLKKGALLATDVQFNWKDLSPVAMLVLNQWAPGYTAGTLTQIK